jgi:hypothetical protein
MLRSLVKCGACAVGCNCHKMRGRNGTWHRYYHCRNHDPIKAGGASQLCPERNIRADALDSFVFDQVRAALLRPDVLLAGEQALAVRTPTPDDELLAAELARLARKKDAAQAERKRLVDLYQAGLIELTEMQQRATEIERRRGELTQRHATLTEQRHQRSGHAQGAAQAVRDERVTCAGVADVPRHRDVPGREDGQDHRDDHERRRDPS